MIAVSWLVHVVFRGFLNPQHGKLNEDNAEPSDTCCIKAERDGINLAHKGIMTQC